MRAPLLHSELAEIRRHAERDYPNEACGFVLRRGWAERGTGADSMVQRCENGLDSLHRSDPVKYPRDAREGFAVSPRDMAELVKRLRNEWTLHAIYHSHTGRPGAVWSDEDNHHALRDGEPVYPKAAQVVFSLPDRRPEMVRAYRWDALRRSYLVVAAAEYLDDHLQQFPLLPLVTGG